VVSSVKGWRSRVARGSAGQRGGIPSSALAVLTVSIASVVGLRPWRDASAVVGFW
jgi:hypothetical protein